MWRLADRGRPGSLASRGAARAWPRVAAVALVALGLAAVPADGRAAAGRDAATASDRVDAAAHAVGTGARARRGVAAGRRSPACARRALRRLTATARFERRVRCLVNRQRLRHGRAPLRHDRCLARAADRHARDMVRHRYFAHTARDGRGAAARARAAGYLRGAARWAVGENLAWGAGAHARPHAIVRAWMRSGSHRANVLAPHFRDVGVAVVRDTPDRRTTRERHGARAADRRAVTVVIAFGARAPRSGCRAVSPRPRR